MSSSGKVNIYIKKSMESNCYVTEFEILAGFETFANKILILGKVGFQSDQIPAASWSGNTCPPSNQLIITLIRLLFGRLAELKMCVIT